MYIPDDKVEEVRSATDIVDVVSDYVRLKKRGANYVGLCPFHNEKTPSFNVNPSMGIFKCFGCSVGGDVFSFLMKVEQLGFPEAVRTLAEKAGVELPEEGGDSEAASETEAVYGALRFAARFFHHQLTQTPGGERGLDYLLGRGLSRETITRFGLGYAPAAWDALLKSAARNHLTPEALEAAGLVIPRRDGNGHYDRYRDRVIFPILSHVGKVLGFGGRVLPGEDDGPKYINSPQTIVYDKSRVLYGLYQGKQEIRRREEAVLVEGYTDVIALHEAGVENVVATSGTALTTEQVAMLGRYARRVVLLYDADTAGANAALRSIDLVLAGGLSAYVVALPGGEDPDSYVRTHGGEAFRAYAAKHRQDFVAFRHEHARRSGQLDTPEGQAAATRAILESVARIPDKLMRDAYLRRTSEVVKEPDIVLFRAMDEILDGTTRGERPRRPAPQPERVESIPPEAYAAPPAPPPEPTEEEKMLIQLMLRHGAPMVEHVLGRMALDEFTEGLTRTMAERLVALYEKGEVSARPFVSGQYGDALQELASGLLMDRHQVSENWERKMNIEVRSMDDDAFAAADAVFFKHRKRLAVRMYKKARQELFLAGKDLEKSRPIQERLNALHAYIKELDPELNLNYELSE